jgi:hypothetical protein
MIPKVQDCYFYSRENNIIYAYLTHGEKIPLIRLSENFIDLNILEGPAFDYMNRYMKMHLHLWERIKEEPKLNQQLTIF